jgi:hypothetical protein
MLSSAAFSLVCFLKLASYKINICSSVTYRTFNCFLHSNNYLNEQ